MTKRKFFKVKFCEYWTSIKIKISMTRVSKEYELTFGGERVKKIFYFFLGGRGWISNFLADGGEGLPI